MIHEGETICPECKGNLHYYDTVKRIVRTKKGKTKWVKIHRQRCVSCHRVHRELPDYIFPYKHYELDIIQGVVEGWITPETLGYEDYPCEAIMQHWITQNLQSLF
jgi:hypothetical protein